MNLPKSLIAILISIGVAHAAINATVTWEVRHAGSDLNGGGWDTTGTGTDMSQFNNKNATSCSLCQSATNNLSTADATANGATTITSATAAFSAAITGNIVYFSGGSGSIAAQRRRATYVNPTTITVDTAIAASTGMTMNVGGALGSPGMAGGLKVAGNQVWIKSDGIYPITSTSANVANGTVSDTTGGVSQNDASVWTGYSSTRGDNGAPPILQASGISGVSLFKASAYYTTLRNIEVDGASLASLKGFQFTAGGVIGDLLTAVNCTNIGIDAEPSYMILSRSSASNITGGIAAIYIGASTAEISFYELEAHDNSVTGINIQIGNCVNCLAYRNGGSAGILLNFAACTNCVSAFNTGAGFYLSTVDGRMDSLINCVAYGNPAATGYITDQVQAEVVIQNCAGESNSYTLANLPQAFGFIALTVNPWVDATATTGHNNFALNNTVGGGLALRGAGLPGITPGGSVGYQDIGAVQHQAAGGSTAQVSYTTVH